MASHSRAEVCQLCDESLHTAIDCPWMYAKCKVDGCSSFCMLLKSKGDLSKGKKLLKCQNARCEGFEWLSDAKAKDQGRAKEKEQIEELCSDFNKRNSLERRCYYCHGIGHYYGECEFNGSPCLKPGCIGKRIVRTSKKDWSKGKVFLICDECNEFEWLEDAVKQKNVDKLSGWMVVKQ